MRNAIRFFEVGTVLSRRRQGRCVSGYRGGDHSAVGRCEATSPPRRRWPELEARGPAPRSTCHGMAVVVAESGMMVG